MQLNELTELRKKTNISDIEGLTIKLNNENLRGGV